MRASSDDAFGANQHVRPEGTVVRIILVGAPGSGKGTQAATLTNAFGIAHISSGDLFREEQERGTELGLLAKQYMERGELVPNEVTIKMILGRIERPDCAKGYILDGFPRNRDQADALDVALAGAGVAGIDKIVYVKVSDEELLKRIAGRGRADDDEATARRRLNVYQEQTAPMIENYRDAGRLVEVNGEASIEQVGKDLVDVLK